MKKAGEIFGLLGELLDYYEYYLMKHEQASLNIIIEDDAISFYLSSNNLDDEIVIHFDKKDEDTFAYLAIKIIIKLFGQVVMHLDDNILYNNVHKKNVKIILLSDKIRKIVEGLIRIQNDEFINDNLSEVRFLTKKANKLYPEKFALELKRRIDLSKELLKKDG